MYNITYLLVICHSDAKIAPATVTAGGYSKQPDHLLGCAGRATEKWFLDVSGKFWMPCTRPVVQFFNMEKSTAHQPVTKLTAGSQRRGRPQYPLPSSTMLSQVARPTKSSNLSIDEALYYLSDPVSCYLNILNQSSRLRLFLTWRG